MVGAGGVEDDEHDVHPAHGLAQAVRAPLLRLRARRALVGGRGAHHPRGRPRPPGEAIAAGDVQAEERERAVARRAGRRPPPTASSPGPGPATRAPPRRPPSFCSVTLNSAEAADAAAAGWSDGVKRSSRARRQADGVAHDARSDLRHRRHAVRRSSGEGGTARRGAAGQGCPDPRPGRRPASGTPPRAAAGRRCPIPRTGTRWPRTRTAGGSRPRAARPRAATPRTGAARR